jgi:hypothetical protein
MGRALEGFFCRGLPDVVTALGELTNDLRRGSNPSPGLLAATLGNPNGRSLFWRKYLLNTDLIDQMLSP